MSPHPAVEAERIARAFHTTYERLAEEFDYFRPPESAKPWGEIPRRDRELMIAVVRTLLDAGTIAAQGQ